MPAYRSSEEGEIRDAVVAHFRVHRPGARIIHEINVSGQGSNRIDLIAVSADEIIAVEIKSAKDKLDRLERQMSAMRDVSHYAVAAVHEKFLVEKPTNEWSAHFERDGVFYRHALPDAVPSVRTWIFPKRVRAKREHGYDPAAKWDMPPLRTQVALPQGALGMLWRDELWNVCGALRLPVGRRATMSEMANALRWLCNGKELTGSVCSALRRRPCIEADPVIESVAA